MYRAALARFAAHDEAPGESYDRSEFERRHAPTTVMQLNGYAQGPDVVFSVRDPLVASGVHGRDGAGAENCCVWTGPSSTFLVYMPAPEGLRLQVRLWIRGYASVEQRQRLSFRIDGAPCPHRFEAAPGYAEVAVLETTARRPFVAIEGDVGETCTTGVKGTASYDSRLRGVAFDRYGWRIQD